VQADYIVSAVAVCVHIVPLIFTFNRFKNFGAGKRSHRMIVALMPPPLAAPH
jgi:hypothetical protein